MRVLKICISEWKNPSHDKRELSVCRELGAYVEVLAKGERSGVIDVVDGFNVIRMSTKPLGNRVPTIINRVASVFSWAAYIRNRNDIDIISGHDYVALLIGYLSNMGKKKKAKLVYDSHEYERARSSETHGKFAVSVICLLENFLIHHAEFTIIVCNSAADQLKADYHLNERPIVARNMPENWTLDENRIRETRDMILKNLQMPMDTFIVMFHGSLRPHNGIELMIEAVSKVPGVVAAFVGPVTEERKKEIINLCCKFSINNRMYFHDAVPLEELYRFVGAADLGVVALPPINYNNIWALPNKLFENIQSLTPVVVNDYPEIAQLVKQYDIGEIIEPDSAKQLSKVIVDLKASLDRQKQLRENLLRAKKELCWEKEKRELMNAYRRIMVE